MGLEPARAEAGSRALRAELSTTVIQRGRFGERGMSATLPTTNSTCGCLNGIPNYTHARAWLQELP